MHVSILSQSNLLGTNQVHVTSSRTCESLKTLHIDWTIEHQRVSTSHSPLLGLLGKNADVSTPRAGFALASTNFSGSGSLITSDFSVSVSSASLLATGVTATKHMHQHILDMTTSNTTRATHILSVRPKDQVNELSY